MKYHVTNFNRNSSYDCAVWHSVIRFLEQLYDYTLVEDIGEAELIILCTTWTDDFDFNADLASRVSATARVVVFDFWEFGAETLPSMKVLGTGRCSYDNWAAYVPLENWIRSLETRVVLHLVRELVKGEATDCIRPIEYANTESVIQAVPEVVPLDAYITRPIDILLIFGDSNPCRFELMGSLIERGTRQGWRTNLCLNVNTLSKLLPGFPTMVLLYQRWNDRLPIEQVYHLQSQSKITVSLSGNGFKCFRHAEAPFGSLMALQDNPLEWSVPWVNGEDCIVLPNHIGTNRINAAGASDMLFNLLHAPAKLYPLYVAAQLKAKHYLGSQYAAYIHESITKAL